MKGSTKLTSAQESLVPKQVRYIYLKVQSRFVIPRQPLSACEQSCEEVHVVIHIRANNVHVQCTCHWLSGTYSCSRAPDLTYKLHIYMGPLGCSHITYKHKASSFKGQRLCTNFRLCRFSLNRPACSAIPHKSMNTKQPESLQEKGKEQQQKL